MILWASKGCEKTLLGANEFLDIEGGSVGEKNGEKLYAVKDKTLQQVSGIDPNAHLGTTVLVGSASNAPTVGYTAVMPQYKIFTWEPEPDITIYELARSMPYLAQLGKFFGVSGGFPISIAVIDAEIVAFENAVGPAIRHWKLQK